MLRADVSPRSLPAVASVALAVILAGCSAPQSTEAPSTVTVFEGARIIVGDGSEPIENAAFVVTNDRITAVGARGAVTVPAGSAHVDLSGKTVMPALLDTHKHLSQTREELVDQLQRLAYYGVGAAMSLGQDTGDAIFQVRAAPIPGAARAFTAGRGITMPEPGRGEAPYWIKTEDEGRKAVQEQAARKVDIIKIWVDDRNGQYEKLTPAMYAAIIDEAHKNNIRVTAHIFALADAKGLLRAGIDSFAHGIRDRDIDDEIVAMFKERPNVVLVPNMPDRGVKADLAWLADSIPAAELAELEKANTDRPDAQKTHGIQARNLAKLHAAGVKVAFGTDGSVPWQPHVELADMVAAGIAPLDVITSATRNSAEFMKMNDAGTVAAGKSADFIVLDANPLDDITNTRRISAVYLRGAAVDRAALRAKWMAPKPAAAPQ